MSNQELINLYLEFAEEDLTLANQGLNECIRLLNQTEIETEDAQNTHSGGRLSKGS